MASQLGALLAAGMIIPGCWALGAALLRLTRLDPGPSLLRQVLAYALGLGACAHALLLLGRLHLYTPQTGWLLLGGMLGLLLWTAGMHWRRRSTLRWPPLTPGEKGLLAVLTWLAGMAWLGGLVPTFAGDTLRHHYAAAQWYVEAGGLVFVPIFYFQQPMLGEMFYVWALLLGNDIIGTLVNASFGVAAALAIYAGARHSLARPVALLAAILFYTLPGSWDYNYAGMPDLGLLLYVLLSVFLFRTWRVRGRWQDLLLAGLCAGFAASVKIIGLYAVFALGLLLLWRLARAHPLAARQRMGLLLIFGAGLVVSGAPWYVHNWLSAGNPVWPIFYPWLGGRCWNATAYAAGLARLETNFTALGRTLPGFLLGPLGLSAGFTPAPLFPAPGIGPLFLALLPVTLLRPRFRRQQRDLLAFAALYYVAWFPFSQYGRFILPVYALLCLPLAQALQWLARRRPNALGGSPTTRRLLRLVAAGSAVVWIGVVGAWPTVRTVTFAPVVLGMETRETFLARATAFYAEIVWMNRRLPTNAVVFSDHLDLYYLERRYLWNDQGRQGFVDYGQIHTADDLAQALGALGVTHLFASGCTGCVDERIARLLQEFLAGYGTPIYTNPAADYPVALVRGESRQRPVTLYALNVPQGVTSPAVCAGQP